MQINEQVASAVNDQIQKEFASFYLYLSMAAYFEDQGLDGFGHWMRLQADEERVHAMKLYDYLLDRGARVRLQAIEQPPVDFDSVKQVVEEVATHEAKVTASIYAIYELATQHNDFATQDHLDWFVQEQVEEEKSANDLVDKVTLIEKHGGSLFMLDRELAKRQEGAHE
jgi:ferritin